MFFRVPPADRMAGAEDLASSPWQDAELSSLNSAYGGVVVEMLGADYEFKAKPGSAVTLRVGVAGVSRFLTLVGLGPKAKASEPVQWGSSAWAKLGEQAAAAAKANKCRSVGVAVLGASSALSADAARATACGDITSGLLSGGYEELQFKSKPIAAIKLERAEILLGVSGSAAAKESIQAAHGVASAAMVSKYVNERACNCCHPPLRPMLP